MGFKPIPGGLTTWLIAAFAGAAGALGSTLLTERTDLLYVGERATGSTVCPADPISGDYVTIGGQNYVIYRTDDDAGIPDASAINCSGDACSAAGNCCAVMVAAVNADPSAKVVATLTTGIDGGAATFVEKDAGMAGNIPIVWLSRTRAIQTDTDSDTAEATGTFTASATETETDTVLITATGTGTATDDSWTVTATGTVTVSFTGSLTSTTTVTGTVTASNSVMGTQTLTASTTATGSETWSGTGTKTATAEVTGEGTDTTTGSSTATQTATASGTATVSATGTVSATATSTYTVTASTTSSGTSTGMTGGKDPVATGGPLLGIIPNTYNPATSGLNAPIGSTARTADETKGWLKSGTGPTEWSPINEF